MSRFSSATASIGRRSTSAASARLAQPRSKRDFVRELALRPSAAATAPLLRSVRFNPRDVWLAMPCRVGVAQILAAAEWPAHKSAVVVVGHQPDLGSVAAFLVSGSAASWSLKKGGAWWLSTRALENGAQVMVRAVVAPDLL